SVPDRSAIRHAVSHLERAARVDPSNSGTWYLIGALAARLGETEYAMEALRRGVITDSGDPLWRYALGEALARRVQGVDWTGLQRVYRQWMARYPQRAEWYVAGAMAACEGQGDRPQAAALVERGRAAAAEPISLLDAYRARLARTQAC
ncbi:MAG: tetratricopeptide repeat protein, partial [Chloroflexota bacterium]